MGYRTYRFQVTKLDNRPYWPRADDPMKIVRKEWERAIETSKYWHLPGYRAKFFRDNDSVARKVRPTLQMSGGTLGATFTTADQYEDIPYGNNESDLKALEIEHNRRYNEATLENTTNRIQMMLGMLGDVKVSDKKEFNLWRLGTRNFKVFEVRGQVLLLFEGDGPE